MKKKQLSLQSILIAAAIGSVVSYVPVSTGDPTCSDTGNYCNSVCMVEKKANTNHTDYKGYCGTTPTGTSTATTGCLCPSGDKADLNIINIRCQAAIETCNKSCSKGGSCATPNNSNPPSDSQCSCSGGYE